MVRDLLSTAHTMRHYKTAYWDSALNDDQPWETWDEQGEVDAATRANKAWKASLASAKSPVLDEGIDEALKDFITCKKVSMDDAWY
jgi:trimethylamine--corrinoid protein Co-methyltransferase